MWKVWKAWLFPPHTTPPPFIRGGVVWKGGEPSRLRCGTVEIGHAEERPEAAHCPALDWGRAMIHVSRHAIQRYQERVAAIPAGEVVAALSSPIIQRASEFGARYVRLSTGHRVVIVEGCVVTVLEQDHERGSLSLAMDRRRERR